MPTSYKSLLSILSLPFISPNKTKYEELFKDLYKKKKIKIKALQN